MASKDFERMIKLGKWLEKFLNPEITLSDYRELAEEAISLYDIDFVLKNDVTLQVVEYLEQQPVEIKNAILDSNSRKNTISDLEDLPYYFPESIIEPNKSLNEISELIEEVALSDKPEFEKRLMATLLDIYQKTILFPMYLFYKKNCHRSDWRDFVELLKSWGHFCYETFFEFIDIKKPALRLLEKIDHSKFSWSHALDDIKQNEREDSVVTFTDEPVTSFISCYNCLAMHFNIKDKTHVVKYTFADLYANSCLLDMPSVFPWAVVFCRSFFDFLIMGGQDYFGFCDFCEKFYIVQRKGRKRFCSDICRTAYQRKLLKKQP